MGEFKGTKGAISHRIHVTDKEIIFFRVDNENDEKDWMAGQLLNVRDADAQLANYELIRDAFTVRQQINCDLPELLRQRNEMLEALREVVRIQDEYYGDGIKTHLALNKLVLTKIDPLIKEATEL